MSCSKKCAYAEAGYRCNESGPCRDCDNEFECDGLDWKRFYADVDYSKPHLCVACGDAEEARETRHPFVESTAVAERAKAIELIEAALLDLKYVVDAPYSIRLASGRIEEALAACNRSKECESRFNDAREAAE